MRIIAAVENPQAPQVSTSMLNTLFKSRAQLIFVVSSFSGSFE
jgi:hypothetical protein